MTWSITRSPAICVRCGQLQGKPHLPACPLKRFTIGAQMEAFDSKRGIEIP